MPKGNSFRNNFWSYDLAGRVVLGKVVFVDSGASNASDGNDGLSPQTACATWDGAIGKCTANNGDHIILLPGHSETISGAAGVALDVAGITSIGVGHGAARPSFNFTATDSTITISAASNWVENILITGGIDAIVNTVVISAADCTLKGLTIRDVTGQMTDSILTTAAADRLHIADFRHEGAAADGGDSAILLVGGTDVHIENFHIVGNFDTGGIESITTAQTQVRINDGYIWNQGGEDLAISLLTGSTGKIGPNIDIMLTDNAANVTEAVACDAAHFFQPIRICNLAGEVALETNITATTDA